MASFLVELPDNLHGGTLPEGADAVVVEAADATDAKEVAKAAFDGDGNAKWGSATVTQLAAAADFSADAWKLKAAILDSSPVVDVEADGGVKGATGVAIDGGGTGYTANDVLTVSGGTSTRAATLRVTSESGGVVDGVEVVDPGEYTALPSNPVAVTGGSGNDDATFDLTETEHKLGNFAAELVGKLNATSPVANATIDMGASPPLLTVAGASDSLGDKATQVTFEMDGVAIPSLVGTITDAGSAGSALTAELAASPTIPKVHKKAKR